MKWIYALVEYSYDYYEFEFLYAVSTDRDKLVEYYHGLKGRKYPLVDKEKHTSLGDAEQGHCLIKMMRNL